MLEITFDGPDGPVVARFDDDQRGRFTSAEWRAHRYGPVFYIRRRGSGATELAHRVICGCVPGDGVVIDHIDGDTLNNCRSNLRRCTNQQNLWNKRTSSATGYLGVTKSSSGRFVGKVRHNGGYHYCGIHDSPEQAALAVNEKLIELRGAFARLNVVPVEVHSCN